MWEGRGRMVWANLGCPSLPVRPLPIDNLKKPYRSPILCWRKVNHFIPNRLLHMHNQITQVALRSCKHGWHLNGKKWIFPFYLLNLWPVTHDSGNMCKAIVVVWRKIELSVCPSRQQLLLKCWGSHRWCFNNNVSPARCWGYQESSELSTIHQGLSRESLSFLWSTIFRIQGLLLWMASKKISRDFATEAWYLFAHNGLDLHKIQKL